MGELLIKKKIHARTWYHHTAYKSQNHHSRNSRMRTGLLTAFVKPCMVQERKNSVNMFYYTKTKQIMSYVCFGTLAPNKLKMYCREEKMVGN